MYKEKESKKSFLRPQADFTKNEPQNKVKFIKKANRWLAYFWTTEGGKLVQKNNWFSTYEEALTFLENYEKEKEQNG